MEGISQPKKNDTTELSKSNSILFDVNENKVFGFGINPVASALGLNMDNDLNNFLKEVTNE